MWIRNSDTGKWSLQRDQLPKDYYDGLKQDLESVKLYSKCLSGSVYISIDNFENIYNTLSIDKIGYWIDNIYAEKNLPVNGPQLSLNSLNYKQFYQKYLKENGFTIKNLFTPTKLINTEIENFSTVDVSTTEEIFDLFGFKPVLIIDGVRLIEGHRVLVKNQMSEVTIPSNIDVEEFFTNFRPVSEYFFVDSGITDVTYKFFNQDNGIYKYSNNTLIRESELMTYDKSYKLKVVVKYGNQNQDKEFHLKRLKNNYYPVDGEGVSFEEKQNWIMRHRLDYNNILDLNHYDILYSKSTQIYSKVENFTYSIPDRLLAVGEFGVIINNQDKLNPNATYSNSTIIDNKYKSSIRSISETNDYYWVCGDEGLLLKIHKTDFSITRIDLGLFSKLTSIDFLDNLNGFLVGDFNVIFYTVDGGIRWSQLNYDEYESFSFNKVLFYDLNKVFMCGNSGFYVELSRDGNSWIPYKRQIFKTLEGDDYNLVESIYDIFPSNWITIKPFSFIYDEVSKDFAQSLEFSFKITPENYQNLQILIDSKYFDNTFFSDSQFYIDIVLKDGLGNIIYEDGNNTPGEFIATEYSFYQKPPAQQNRRTKFSQIINLSKNIDGNLKNDIFNLTVEVYYNYDGENNQVLEKTFLSESFEINFSTSDCKILILSTDDKLIIHDLENKIYDYGKDFIYIEFNKSIGDIRTITKPEISTNERVYLGGDRLYYFNLSDIVKYPNTGENFVSTKLFEGPDLYVNKLISLNDKLYMSGNESLLKEMNFSDFGGNNSTRFWDPTFSGKYKSRFLFLDYDIASKVNFFTDLGQYRLPESKSFDKNTLTSSTSYLLIESLSGQKSWVDYYKDGEKTFEYYTYIGEDKKVEFSTNFEYSDSVPNFFFTNDDISDNLDDILKFAPSLIDSKSSEFMTGLTPILNSTDGFPTQPSTLSDSDVLIYKNIIIFKRPFGDNTKVGDTLRLESEVIDVNLLVNKVSHYYKLSGGSFELITTPPSSLALNSTYEKYIYCYNTFNQNIINNLKIQNTPISITNLNYYSSIDTLLKNFENHPISIAYKLSESSDKLVISARLNNKTAYYNLGVKVEVSGIDHIMNYQESFLTFGFSPTYNISEVLNRIDSETFPLDKKFTILPEYYNLPGCTSSSFTFSNIQIVGDQFNNKLTFGKELEFQWESLLLWTFVDFVCWNNVDEFVTNEKLLIINKYYDSNQDGFVIEFHKSIKLPNLETGIKKLDILSRNSLSQIGNDLEILNNIQRASSEKSINSTYSFSQYENEVKFKFPTDSYLKALVSDYDIVKDVTGIVYTDYDYQLCLNINNVEKKITYDFNRISQQLGGDFDGKVVYSLTTVPKYEVQIGDLVRVELLGGSQSSKVYNSQYQGFQTILDIKGQFITTAVDYGMSVTGSDFGSMIFIKKDKFLNYLPIDLYSVGGDKKPKQSIEILPEMVTLEGEIISLKNIDLKKYKLQLVDGLFLQEIEDKYSWFLQAETSNAVVGKNRNGLVWYSGVWRCGRWFGGTWISGTWVSGDWYGGEWYSSKINSNIPTTENLFNGVDYSFSKWQSGRWFDGKWYGGTWYDGRRYGGEWYEGLWFGGVWNDGDWYGGEFRGGIWVLGNFFGGVFNCDSKLSFWLDGIFESGDFENGTWYNGQFGNKNNLPARFGTRSVNTRITTWHGGKWINGEFHSFLNTDENSELPIVSDIHTLSVWRTGLWLGGDFYGGVAYNIDFRGGVWHGGILDEIQIIGIDPIYPQQTSNNKIYLNGIFKFNVGDIIWIIDDDKGGKFSPIGNNQNPSDYRINKIEEDVINSRTGLFLNFNLSNLNPPIDNDTGTQSWIDVETNLRVVSHFDESIWKSGYWTNGYFQSGNFESGIWNNGVFEGIWGN